MLYMRETIVIHFLLYLCKKNEVLSLYAKKTKNKSTFFIRFFSSINNNSKCDRNVKMFFYCKIISLN